MLYRIYVTVKRRSVQYAHCVRNIHFSIKRNETSEATNVRECIILHVLDYTVIFARYYDDVMIRENESSVISMYKVS